MNALIGRDFCLRHPGRVIKAFGIGTFFGMIVGRERTLLERVTEDYAAHAFPLPGTVGRAYRLAALIECRVAHFYGRLAERFEDHEPVHLFFRTLQREEEEHSRLMELCRYTITLNPKVTYTPGPRDPDIRPLLGQLRRLQELADVMSLDDALDATAELEQGEVNVIFARLLRQADRPQSRLFEERLHEAEDHSQSVPRRIADLRRQLEMARAA